MGDPYSEESTPAATTDPYSEESTPLIVEFTTSEGDKSVRQIGIFDRFKKPELVQKSESALDKSMTVIQKMSKRVNTTVQALDQKPDQLEVDFGIKFDGEFGIIIAKASIEASMNVKLVWKR